MSSERKAKSPCQRYGKTPFRYSELYNRWRTAALAGRDDEARRLSREHFARFGQHEPVRAAA